MELKNQVIRTTSFKVMAEYISIYFDIFQYILIYFNIFRYISLCLDIFQYISIYFSWITLDDIMEHKKQNYFRQGFALDYLWPSFWMVLNAGTPSKNVSFKKVIFRGLRLFHSHFGQHVPENLVSQLQNGVLTSFLPPFIVDSGKGPATKLDDFSEKCQRGGGGSFLIRKFLLQILDLYIGLFLDVLRKQFAI